ncbi:MAG: BatD family protein [Flavobacteriaceae bacterium]
MKSFLATYKIISLLVLALFIQQGYGQEVTASIDRDSLLIGEQIELQLSASADPEALILFPEGQTFYPLEVVNESAIDTLSKRPQLSLRKTYKITQFDAGDYLIAPQQITINRNPYTTEAIPVRINDVVVDTTAQGLYDIKPLGQKAPEPQSHWPYVLITALIAIGLLVYFKRSREKKRVISPFEEAIRSIDRLKQIEVVEAASIYYSATSIFKTYLHRRLSLSTEQRTSKELIGLLESLGQNEPYYQQTKEQQTGLKELLNRAELYKFAKQSVTDEQRSADLLLVSQTIEAYEEGYLRKLEALTIVPQKKNRVKQRTIIAVSTLIIVLGSLGVYGYLTGYQNLWDSITLNPFKKSYEQIWVSSSYGFPPVSIESPEALLRNEEGFSWNLNEDLTVSIRIEKSQSESEVDFVALSEAQLLRFEEEGFSTILPKSEIYNTKEEVTGYHSFGTALDAAKNERSFDHLIFGGKGFSQEVVITYPTGDRWAEQIAARIMESIKVTTEL